MNKTEIKSMIKELKTIKINELSNYDLNSLKDNQNRDLTKLKNSIKENGFIDPLKVWYDENDQGYIFDGTGRVQALKQLIEEGYSIDEVQLLVIEAKDLKTAKKYALLISSTYGKITQTSLADFTSNDFELDELKELSLNELELYPLDLVLSNINDEFNSDYNDFKPNSSNIYNNDVQIKGNLENKKILFWNVM